MSVSVIMTVFNGERYLEQAVKSVLAQKGINVELVIVDDGSTDGTRSILKKYGDRHDVKIIYSEKIGRGHALNLAITHTNHDYIANIDADDMFHPEKLRIQYEIMENNPDIAVLCTMSAFISSKTKTEDLHHENAIVKDVKAYRVNDRLGYRNPVSHITVMMRKNAIEKVGLYDTKRKSLFDYDLWIRMAKHHYGIYKIDIPLAYKRMHKNQNFERKKRIRYVAAATALQRKAIMDLGLPKWLYLLSYVRFVYGLLPVGIRLKINRQ